jgi:hypothetical protein
MGDDVVRRNWPVASAGRQGQATPRLTSVADRGSGGPGARNSSSGWLGYTASHAAAARRRSASSVVRRSSAKSSSACSTSVARWALSRAAELCMAGLPHGGAGLEHRCATEGAVPEDGTRLREGPCSGVSFVPPDGAPTFVLLLFVVDTALNGWRWLLGDQRRRADSRAATVEPLVPRRDGHGGGEQVVVVDDQGCRPPTRDRRCRMTSAALVRVADLARRPRRARSQPRCRASSSSTVHWSSA